MFPIIKSEIIEAGGLPFEVDTCGNPESDHLVLLLHGFPESAYAWHNQMPALADLGYRIWAPNQRGYGRSFRPNSVDAYDLDHLVADVGYLIDASGCSKVTLIGHDVGGAVAWAAALKGVRPIENLVIMNCPHPRRFAESMRSWKQLKRFWYMLFFQVPLLPEWLLSSFSGPFIDKLMHAQSVHKERFPPSVCHEFKQNLRCKGGARAMINWYRAAARRRKQPSTDVSVRRKLTVPTLMIWGAQDSVLGPEFTDRMDELVEDVTVCCIEDASHWVQQDAPQRCNALLTAWLKGEPLPDLAPSKSTSTPRRAA